MTEIGSNLSGPQTPAPPASGARPRRMQSLLHSLTDSLDLACRGYLCMQLVDCDSTTDPECGPTGKKLVFRAPAEPEGAASAEMPPPAGT
jgi:hypothetical protein